MLKFYDSWNRGEIDFDELIDEDIVNHQPDVEPQRGRDPFREAIARVMAAVPDSRWDVSDVLTDGDRVAIRITWSGERSATACVDLPTTRRCSLAGCDAKLLHHCQVVPDHPMFGQSAACHAIDVHVLNRELGWRPNPPATELRTEVGPTPSDPDRDPIAVS